MMHTYNIELGNGNILNNLRKILILNKLICKFHIF